MRLARACKQFASLNFCYCNGVDFFHRTGRVGSSLKLKLIKNLSNFLSSSKLQNRWTQLWLKTIYVCTTKHWFLMNWDVRLKCPNLIVICKNHFGFFTLRQNKNTLPMMIFFNKAKKFIFNYFQYELIYNCTYTLKRTNKLIKFTFLVRSFRSEKFFLSS